MRLPDFELAGPGRIQLGIQLFDNAARAPRSRVKCLFFATPECALILSTAVASKFIPQPRRTLAPVDFGSRTHLPLLKLFGRLIFDVQKTFVVGLEHVVRVSPRGVVDIIQLFLIDTVAACNLWIKHCAWCARLFALKSGEALA